MNLPPDGLSTEQISRTRGGLLTGWIWLSESIFPSDHSMKKRTIIYTDYMRALKENVSDADLEEIYVVPKKGSQSPAQRILKYVNIIDKRNRRNT